MTLLQLYDLVYDSMNFKLFFTPAIQGVKNVSLPVNYIQSDDIENNNSR